MIRSLVIWLISTSLCMAQQGMMPGPGTVHSVGGGGGTYTKIDVCAQSGLTNCNWGGAPSVGDTITVTVMWVGGNAVATCTDGATHNFTMPATVATSGGGLQTQNGYILQSTSGASATVTCAAGSTSYIEVHAGDFKNTGGTPVFDQVVASPTNSTASGTSITLPTFTPATAGSLAWCAVLVNNGNISAPVNAGTLSGWTGAHNPNGGSEYKLSAAASSQGCAFTASVSGDDEASVVTVIKP